MYVESALISRYDLPGFVPVFPTVMVELVASEVTLKPAYCADVADMFVATSVPSVVSIVNAPAVKFALVRLDIPAIAISRYCVRPLFV